MVTNSIIYDFPIHISFMDKKCILLDSNRKMERNYFIYNPHHNAAIIIFIYLIGFLFEILCALTFQLPLLPILLICNNA